jgi:prefoldin subunit 5
MELGISEKMLLYQIFINDVAMEDQKKFNTRWEQISSEFAEYLEFGSFIQNISNVGRSSLGLKTPITSGCSFYIQANISIPSTILAAVGLGHYVEMTMEEAFRFAIKRVKLLHLKAEKLVEDRAKNTAMLKCVLRGLQELLSTRPSSLQ